MIFGDGGPLVVLTAADCALINRVVLDELARQSRRNGATPARLREIASEVDSAARRFQNSRRSASQVKRLRGTSEPEGAAGLSTVNVAQAAAMLGGISESRVRQMLRSRQLQGWKSPADVWVVDVASVKAACAKKSA
ncbi:hypothetical protein [Streptomyces silvisoli]|uniref:DNA-binding protein n=1 Tax=Streptomyces silvisoli TaxID=3034235 RepID=A0ABT5ZLN7_9ACTN|nr:hypothetical protein [Streptomyces silvisoli]MDF3290742.1 hypothetical protein [Streptomyces silvisoli]